MRSLVVLAALLLTATAAAQDMTFTEAHQIRLGFGDLPSTDATENGGQWNVLETHILTDDVVLPLPAGAMDPLLSGASNATLEEDGYHLTVDGTETVNLTYALPGNRDVIATTFSLSPDSHVILYTGPGAYVHAAAEGLSVGQYPGVSGVFIHDFTGSLPQNFWLNVAPIAPAATGVDTPGFGLDAMSLILGIVAGGLVWSLLVARGVVQKRSRKQVASTAAHKGVAAKEPADVLAGRKRLLMAALKDLEMAKMNKEMETDVYDALKSDFKKQTVTVMRAIEEAS